MELFKVDILQRCQKAAKEQLQDGQSASAISVCQDMGGVHVCVNFHSEVTESVAHGHEQLLNGWCLWAVLKAMMSSAVAKEKRAQKSQETANYLS